MDKLEQLGSQISQITLYDIKGYYNQAKNIILNVSEMEAKVQEATNDEPWGASSTLMNEIAQGTFNFQAFNEIMPAIYARFMEKEARQWRQIYKALQLLEHLIKNGSERTVDDGRSHIGTIKMLRNFHYIDEKGKDQGINVRNRAREIVELLNDLDRVRSERRKAKGNRNKYTGVGNDSVSFSSGSGGRYGGFGSDSLSGGGGGGYDRDYGGSSSYNGGRSSSAAGGAGRYDDSRANAYEYDAGDDEDLPRRNSGPSLSAPARQPTRASTTSSSSPYGHGGRGASMSTSSTANPAPPPKSQTQQQVKQPEIDLLGGLEEEVAPTTPEKSLPSYTAALTSSAVGEVDEFGDFEAAPSASASVPAQAAVAPAQVRPIPPLVVGSAVGNKNLFDLLGQNGSGAGTAAPAGHGRQLSGGMGPGSPMNMNMGIGMGMGSPPMNMNSSMGMGMGMGSPPMSPPANTMGMGMGMMSPTLNPQRTTGTAGTAGTMGSFQTTASQAQPVKSAPATKSQGSIGGFEDLWSMSLGSSSVPKKAANPTSGKSILELEREKAQKGLWGGAISNSGGDPFGGMGSGGPRAAAPPSSGGGGGFGNFGSTSTSGGDDNLLL